MRLGRAIIEERPVAPPGNPVFALGDSLRAVGLLAVIATHSAPVVLNRWYGVLAWNSGYVALDVFFLLSAFLLYRPYVLARDQGRPLPSTRNFLRRRALRILPAYWLALTLLALWPGLPGVFSGQWWRYYAFLQIYPGAPAGGLGVAWSLCVEMTFYLLLPLYAALMASVARRLREGRWWGVELAVLGLLGAVSVVFRAFARSGHLPYWTYVALPGKLDFFALGMLLAMLSVRAGRRSRPPTWWALIDRFPGAIFALAAVVFVAMTQLAPAQDPSVPLLHLVRQPITFGHEEANYWLGAMVALLMMLPVVFGHPRRGTSRRLLGLRPVLGLGAVSYASYLWHDPLLVWISHWVGPRPWLSPLGVPFTLVVLTLAVTVPIAVVSYRYVELPFLRRRYDAGMRRHGSALSRGRRGDDLVKSHHDYQNVA